MNLQSLNHIPVHTKYYSRDGLRMRMYHVNFGDRAHTGDEHRDKNLHRITYILQLIPVLYNYWRLERFI